MRQLVNRDKQHVAEHELDPRPSLFWRDMAQAWLVREFTGGGVHPSLKYFSGVWEFLCAHRRRARSEEDEQRAGEMSNTRHSFE